MTRHTSCAPPKGREEHSIPASCAPLYAFAWIKGFDSKPDLMPPRRQVPWSLFLTKILGTDPHVVSDLAGSLHIGRSQRITFRSALVRSAFRCLASFAAWRNASELMGVVLSLIVFLKSLI